MTQARTDASASRPVSARTGRGGPIARFIKEIISEMRKVRGPSRRELIVYTAVVIVFVVVMVSLVAGLDIGFARLILLLFG